jgi:hypothetical protein
MVEGVGSGMLESGSHSSCVSSVVSSVSVDAAEWAIWPRCCGVEHDAAAEGFPAGEDSNNLRHVHLRSIPVAHKIREHADLKPSTRKKYAGHAMTSHCLLV